MKQPESLPQKAALKALRGYQLVVSPLLGQCCRFYPSCSAYAREAIQAHGVIKGSWLSARRVARCGPFHPGGYDPVPKKQGADERPTKLKVSCQDDENVAHKVSDK